MRTDNALLETKSLTGPVKERDKDTFKELLVSDLNFKTTGNNGYQRYYWHAFPAKFPRELPRLFIQHLTAANDIVLDPMAGSCARKLGNDSVLDILDTMIRGKRLRDISDLPFDLAA